MSKVNNAIDALERNNVLDFKAAVVSELKTRVLDAINSRKQEVAANIFEKEEVTEETDEESDDEDEDVDGEVAEASKYKGKNPEHINSVSAGSGGVAHVKLNNGTSHKIHAKDNGHVMPKVGVHISKYKVQKEGVNEGIGSDYSVQTKTKDINSKGEEKFKALHKVKKIDDHPVAKKHQFDGTKEHVKEGVIEDLQKISKSPTGGKIKFQNGKIEEVDSVSAGMILKYYGKVAEQSKTLLKTKLGKNLESFMEVLDIAASKGK